MIAVDEQFSVVGEGEGWIVVNKGAPLIVHPANDRGEESTLLGGVKELLAYDICLLYTSPSPRDQRGSRMPSSA